MKHFSVVTGANGHLGNNLVRFLLEKGETVVAGTRRGDVGPALQGLSCSITNLDLTNPESLHRGFSGAHTVYLVGAVFSHWARHAKKEIYEANMTTTRNALEAAAKCAVQRVVYVSSLAATDRSRNPIAESGWNLDDSNLYFRSKTDSEKLAWQLAEKYRLNMVSVLPSAMIGEHCFKLTPTMELFHTILSRRLDVNPGFWFNFVDVRDVAEGCWLAAKRGRSGQRYLLANENCTSVSDLATIARTLFPRNSIPVPRHMPRGLIWLFAGLAEFWSALSKTPPTLQRNFLRAFTVQEECDIGKARRELGFSPRPPIAVIEDNFRYLSSRALI